MKIQVEFLSLPKVTRIIGCKSIDFDLRGRTIFDLIQELSSTYGDELAQFLLDRCGKLDTAFKIMINKKVWISEDMMDTPLQEGDQVTIMMLVGGG